MKNIAEFRAISIVRKGEAARAEEKAAGGDLCLSKQGIVRRQPFVI